MEDSQLKIYLLNLQVINSLSRIHVVIILDMELFLNLWQTPFTEWSLMLSHHLSCSPSVIELYRPIEQMALSALTSKGVSSCKELVFFHPSSASCAVSLILRGLCFRIRISEQRTDAGPSTLKPYGVQSHIMSFSDDGWDSQDVQNVASPL